MFVFFKNNVRIKYYKSISAFRGFVFTEIAKLYFKIMKDTSYSLPLILETKISFPTFGH